MRPMSGVWHTTSNFQHHHLVLNRSHRFIRVTMWHVGGGEGVTSFLVVSSWSLVTVGIVRARIRTVLILLLL